MRAAMSPKRLAGAVAAPAVGLQVQDAECGADDAAVGRGLRELLGRQAVDDARRGAAATVGAD